MSVTIDDSRIDQLLNILAVAANGDYAVRVELKEHEDSFLEVELGINYLLEELSERRAQNEAQNEELATRAHQLAAQQEELVQALSTPVIAVWPGVLALPLVGRIDDERAATITSVLLDQVVAQRATHVILDLTGVGVIAATTMPAILRVVRAIGLLGASCLVTGIRPDVAQQITALGEHDTRLRSLPRLADALAAVLAETGTLRR